MPRNTEHLNVGQNSISANNHFNIIDILLLDHSYLKECIEVLKDEDETKKNKYKFAKSFLDTLKKHSAGEKRALYAPLLEAKEFRALILKGQIEHGIIDSKVKTLTAKIAGMSSLNETLEAEMIVLAEMVERHLEEEENELFPQMQEEIDRNMLNEMGYQFMLARQFTEKDLAFAPDLTEEFSFIKNAPRIPAAQFLARTHDYLNCKDQ